MHLKSPLDSTMVFSKWHYRNDAAQPELREIWCFQMFQLHEIPFECALSELLAKSSELGWCTGVLAGEWNGERPGRTIKHPFMKGQMICHALIEKREQHNQRIIKNECEYLELPN
jgi:hypothetical protein